MIGVKSGIFTPLCDDSPYKPQKRKFLLSLFLRAINIMLEIPIEIDRLAPEKNHGGRPKKDAIDTG